ncbi:hypothetical protein K8352_12700 [Flavobacteriaceae bacterium F89]|uniref:Uncharacterized protein n=1 Tax=Cerina litoralis TaxID=2874477 RepID=A0AAE3JTL1_9FLAO|nr:hypothetical protein [Cerina litoralis]MCG2461612.1 hypothetical protein [Cerina litoralis]
MYLVGFDKSIPLFNDILTPITILSVLILVAMGENFGQIFDGNENWSGVMPAAAIGARGNTAMKRTLYDRYAQMDLAHPGYFLAVGSNIRSLFKEVKV